VIINLFQQITLNGKRIIQIFPVEVLLGLFHKHTSNAEGVKLRSTCPAYHLHDVCDRKIHVPLGFCVVVFGAFDDHEARGEVDPPCESGRRDQHLDFVVQEHVFNGQAIRGHQTSVVHSDSEG